jgi:acetyl-CoA carboxylase carboxyltransferase component
MVVAPMAGVVVDVLIRAGDSVSHGQVLVVLEAMKMEHEVLATSTGVVTEVFVSKGQMMDEGAVLLKLMAQALVQHPSDIQLNVSKANAIKEIRHDLKAVLDRTQFVFDSARPQAMAKRHALGMQSARENIERLCDQSSFIEFGALAVAAQSNRRSQEDLIANTPADGIVTGIGKVGGLSFAVFAYDMTVLAGTQGMRSHQKTDRLLEVALARRLPVILFAEGGGGRPGDTDMPIIAGLNVATFSTFAKLSGVVPLIGIVAGRCFAGNAALLGCCDVIIATKNSNIGMGGPAMVEGGGLGVFKPEEIGPSNVQSANSVIDILVDDEPAAVDAAKHFLSYAVKQLRSDFELVDQKLLREVVPENRLRSYQVRDAIDVIFDVNSLQELQAGYGVGVVTAFARLAGSPVAVIANNPFHLGGAIDADAADKLAEFLGLCSRYELPIVSLVDTPGFMVGPEIEAKAQVRYASGLFIASAKLKVPVVAVVLRKGYGLGAMAMTAGGFHQTSASIAWPTAEFGAMGLEGSVRLGYRKELDACTDTEQRAALYEKLLAKQYEQGKAIRMAETLEIDAVIDPAKTRDWLISALLLG